MRDEQKKLAINSDDLEVVRQFFEENPHINDEMQYSKERWEPPRMGSPLFYAVVNGKFNSARALIECGANVGF